MTNLSSSYAEALFDLSAEENTAKSILDDLSVICSVFAENKNYIKLMDAPQIKFEKKASLIDEAFSGAQKHTLSFLKLLAKNRIFRIVFDCQKEFEKKYNEINGIEKVCVVSAYPLTDKIKEKLELKLAEITGKKIIASYETDKSVIGGLIVKTTNSQIDASVRTKLEQIKQRLCEV